MPKETLPELTHLQFLVLAVLSSNEMKGKELREALKKEGVNKTGPAFYQIMSRLEEAKFVESWMTQEIVEGQIIKEKNYKITGLGERSAKLRYSQTTSWAVKFGFA